MEDWRQRLEYAHRYWEEKGLTADPNHPNSAARFVKYYRGDQWDNWGWAGVPKDKCITVNVTLSNTNALLGRISNRYPQPVVVSMQKTGDESARARRVELTLRYFMRELKMKRQVDRAAQDAALGPFGIIQHFYMPKLEKYNKDGKEIETYSQARPNLPGIRRRPWWDVRIDPLAESWEPDGTARWVAFRDLYTKDQLKDHPKITVRDDLMPTKSADLVQGNPRDRKLVGQSPEWQQLYEVWWVYEKTEKTLFALSPGSRKPLMDPEEWPIYWEHLPYSFLAFNEQVDTNVPMPYPAAYADQQVELNKNRTLMAELVKRLRRITLGQRGAYNDADRARLESGDLALQEFFFVDGDLAQALGQVQLGVFPQELLLYDAKIKEDIREAIGLSQMDRAQRVNVQSASEAVEIQQGSDVQISRPQEKFQDFWQDVLTRFHQGLQQVLSRDVLVPIVGTQDAAALEADGEYVSVSPDDIKGQYHISIGVGSTMPENHEVRFAKAIQLKTLFKDDATVNQLELSRLAFEESGFDSKQLVQTPAQVTATQDQLMQQGLGGGQGGGTSKSAAPGNTGLDANFVRSLAPTGAVQ